MGKDGKPSLEIIGKQADMMMPLDLIDPSKAVAKKCLGQST